MSGQVDLEPLQLVFAIPFVNCSHTLEVVVPLFPTRFSVEQLTDSVDLDKKQLHLPSKGYVCHCTALETPQIF